MIAPSGINILQLFSVSFIFFSGAGLQLVDAGYESRICSDHSTTWADLAVAT